MNHVLPVVISVGYGRHLFSVGNSERARMQICAAETSAYHMVIFSRKADGLQTEVVDEKLTLHPTNALCKLTMVWRAYRLVAKIIQKYPKQKIIVTTQDPFEAGLVGYLIRLRYRVSLVVQEHADAFSLPYWRRESFGNRVRYFLGKFILRKADVVRVVAERIEATMRAMQLSAKITRLPVAIDLPDFSNNSEKENQTKKDEFWFLSVARFVPQKNFPVMVRAFAKAYRKNPKLRLQIVGQGPEQARIEAEIASQFPPQSTTLTPIIITPWSDNVPALMREADAYLLTSNYEGWARVLIESLVCGLPVVTTDVGCAHEVVKHDVHGLVVPVANQSDITEAILRISTDRSLYDSFVTNIQRLQTAELRGVGIDTYGKEWLRTLE